MTVAGAARGALEEARPWRRDPAVTGGAAPAGAPGRAQLAVAFAAEGHGRTYIGAQRATHPFHVGRALYRPEDPPGFCALYVQGCSGGLFERDRVALSFAAGREAKAHVTTAASTIVHRMSGGGWAEQAVELEVASGAILEYAPDPLILFPGSRLRTTTRVRISEGARAIVVDGWIAHRLPDDARPFDALEGETRVEDTAGRLVARERFLATGAAFRAGGRGQMGRYACSATVLVLGAGDAPLGPLRAALAAGGAAGQPGGDLYGGASTLPGGVGVIGRLLALDGTGLRAGLDACAAAARVGLGLPPGWRRPK